MQYVGQCGTAYCYVGTEMAQSGKQENCKAINMSLCASNLEIISDILNERAHMIGTNTITNLVQSL